MDFRAVIRTGWTDPLAVLAGMADQPWAVGLLSDGSGARGRWSYVARDPDDFIEVTEADGHDPFAGLGELRGPLRPRASDGPAFQGGLIGIACYEAGIRAEGLPVSGSGWPDLACARYPAVLAFDHASNEVWAIGRGSDQPDADARASRALSWLDEAIAEEKTNDGPLAAPLVADDAATYEAAVAQVIERIAAGEIFQANIARRWQGRLLSGTEPFALARRLARQSPAPFAAYFRLADRAVVSNSPERFVQIRAEAGAFQIETRPIKGTAPRGRSPTEDVQLAEALAGSVKDRAENVMIVDLMRNDLARVSPPGSVAVPDLFRIETFANVHHLVSTVTSRLAPGLDAIDLMRSAFPPGSVTGAPKIQAMKVIAGLDPPRGPYCGSIFWAGFDGAFDSSVLIRTAVFEHDAGGWRLDVRAGAGIVADSQPGLERRETEAKISAMLRALGGDAV